MCCLKVWLVNCVPLLVMTPFGTPKWQTSPLKNLTADCAITFLKALGMNLAVMIAAQGLLVACCSHSRPETIFLKERCVILPQSLLLKLIIREHSR